MRCVPVLLVFVLAASMTAVHAGRAGSSRNLAQSFDITSLTSFFLDQFQNYWGNCCGAGRDCDANCTLAAQKSDPANGYIVKCTAQDPLDACCLAHDTCYPWSDEPNPAGEFTCTLPTTPATPVEFFRSCDEQLISCAKQVSGISLTYKCNFNNGFQAYLDCLGHNAEMKARALGVVAAYEAFYVCGEVQGTVSA